MSKNRTNPRGKDQPYPQGIINIWMLHIHQLPKSSKKRASLKWKTMRPIGARNLMQTAWQPWNRSGRSTTAGDIMLNQDFKEFIESLNKNDVRYLVAGSYAVALHGTTLERPIDDST
jgi:hypothetical protein